MPVAAYAAARHGDASDGGLERGSADSRALGRWAPRLLAFAGVATLLAVVALSNLRTSSASLRGASTFGALMLAETNASGPTKGLGWYRVMMPAIVRENCSFSSMRLRDLDFGNAVWVEHMATDPDESSRRCFISSPVKGWMSMWTISNQPILTPMRGNETNGELFDKLREARDKLKTAIMKLVDKVQFVKKRETIEHAVERHGKEGLDMVADEVKKRAKDVGIDDKQVKAAEDGVQDILDALTPGDDSSKENIDDLKDKSKSAAAKATDVFETQMHEILGD